jgi:hypothetical protein
MACAVFYEKEGATLSGITPSRQGDFAIETTYREPHKKLYKKEQKSPF